MRLGAACHPAASGPAFAMVLLLAPAAGWSSTPETPVVWVRFADRGMLARAPESVRRQAALATLSARSLGRRRRRGVESELSESDLPVDSRYVAVLSDLGFRVRTVSRWLNAASVEAPPGRLPELATLPFVAAVEPLPRARRMEPESVTPIDELAGARGGGPPPDPGDPAFYGYSAAQNRLVEVDRLHAAGLSGRGILVAMLDTGFRETHQVFDSLDVVARWDFVHGDSIVANQTGQDGAGQDSHGTSTLSVIGAYLPGRMVGAAYRARFALAKTENESSELPVEMDYWQAAAEWADSLGADVISSSLGYNVFDTPQDSYPYAGMDGRTTVVTRAAAEAARRGIVVVTAQGNDGNLPWHYLLAPADADSVCAVGATDSTGSVTSFSAYGPSADGRIKPDVCAMGSLAALVTTGNDSTIAHGSGTSFSTPEIAGLAALLLEAHPQWTPFEVIESLRATADRFDAPDAHAGFGVARGERALAWTPSTVFAVSPPGAPALVVVGPVPARPGGTLAFWMRAGGGSGSATVDVFDARGRHLRSLFEGTVRAGSERLLSWDGRDGAGVRVPAGIYFVRLDAPGVRLGRRLILL